MRKVGRKIRILLAVFLVWMLGFACSQLGFEAAEETRPPCKEGEACDDGDPCTMQDICIDEACAGLPLDADADDYVALGCGGDDCDDGDDQIHPGAVEDQATGNCDDGLDNDCDGFTDVEDPACASVNCSPDGWCLQPAPADGLNLNDVFGFTANDVWAVGDAGLVLHFDGNTWISLDFGTSENLRAVGGTQSDDIWVVGDHGTVIRRLAGLTMDMQAPSTADLLDVEAQNSGDISVIGRDTTYLTWSGGEWDEEDTTPMDFDLRALWTDPSGGRWVVGESEHLWQGQSDDWIQAMQGADFVRWHDICGLDEQHFYWVGSEGTRGFRDDGTWSVNGWNEVIEMPTLLSVWCDDAPFMAWTVGEAGSIWIDEIGTRRVEDSGVHVDLHAIWSDGQGRYFVVGAGGTILVK